MSISHSAAPTTADNLICLCRKHHRERHLGKWNAILAADGDLTWTSPSGRIDITHPDNPITVPKPRPLSKPPKVEPPRVWDAWFVDPGDDPDPVYGPSPF